MGKNRSAKSAKCAINKPSSPLHASEPLQKRQAIAVLLRERLSAMLSLASDIEQALIWAAEIADDQKDCERGLEEMFKTNERFVDQLGRLSESLRAELPGGMARRSLTITSQATTIPDERDEIDGRQMTSVEIVCEHAIKTLPDSPSIRVRLLAAVEEILHAVRHPQSERVRAFRRRDEQAIAETALLAASFRSPAVKQIAS